MRGGSSSRPSTKSGMEEAEPPFSGSSIRSLVKQLSSSRPREIAMAGRHARFSGLPESHEPPPPSSPPPPPPPPRPRKQARRRLHTSRPYQERLLDMAEARREIVTALKFHRAAMRRATEKQNQLPPSSSQFEDSHKFSCCICPQILPPFPIHDTLDLPLPDQPLGLTLNFQAFPNIEISASSNSSARRPPATEPALHPAMGDEEMAEIRSMSEKHDIEWNDTVNWMTSAWWSKILTSVEGGGDAFQGGSGGNEPMEDHRQDP